MSANFGGLPAIAGEMVASLGVPLALLADAVARRLA